MQKTKRKLEPVKPKEKAQYGFDLTDFDGSEKLRRFFEKNKITINPTREEKKCGYVFNQFDSDYKYNENFIILGAHPFEEGLLFDTEQGTRGDGYCSYIGIEGTEDFIKKVAEFIHENADYIKGYDENNRSFI